MTMSGNEALVVIAFSLREVSMAGMALMVIQVPIIPHHAGQTQSLNQLAVGSIPTRTTNFNSLRSQLSYGQRVLPGCYSSQGKAVVSAQ
jgi:hypothetical protein